MSRNNKRRVYPKTHIPKKELFSLLAMLQSISHTTELDMALEVILDRVRLITKSRFAILKLTGNSRKRLYTAASSGFKNGICHTISKFDDGMAKKALGQVPDHCGC